MIHRNDPSLLEPQKDRNYRINITSSSMKFDHSLLYCDTVSSRQKVTDTEKLLRCGLWSVNFCAMIGIFERSMYVYDGFQKHGYLLRNLCRCKW